MVDRPAAMAALSKVHASAHRLQEQLRTHRRADLTDLGELAKAARDVALALGQRPAAPWHRR